MKPIRFFAPVIPFIPKCTRRITTNRKGLTGAVSTKWTVPLLLGQIERIHVYAIVVEPFIAAVLVVAADHLLRGGLPAEAVRSVVAGSLRSGRCPLLQILLHFLLARSLERFLFPVLVITRIVWVHLLRLLYRTMVADQRII